MKNEQTVECLLCGSLAELRQKEYPGYQEPDTFEIYHCFTCNTGFSLPRIETAKIYENIYKNGDKVPGYDRYWEFARIIKSIDKPLDYLAEKEETYWGVRETLSLFVKDKKDKKILEIGSGLGYLTYSLIKANYNVIGLDISQTAVKQAKENFGDYYYCADLFEYAKLYPESFDIVVMTEVIEHVDKPLDFIESILSLLKAGGKAIITTPNKSLFPSDIIWISDLPPIHCWWFSEESMKYIGAKLNLNIKYLNFTNYYKTHYQAVNLKAMRKSPIRQPMLNENGLLIQKIVETPNSFLNTNLSRIPFFKKIYRTVRDYFNSNIIVCKEEGTVLCAIFDKI